MSIDDDATEYEELDREIALTVRKPTLPRLGECHNCGKPVEHHYCDVYFREDHQKRELK